MSTFLWVLAIALGACLILQGVVLRLAYRRQAALQRAKHMQFEQTMNGKLEQTKRQIGQLQSDLAEARGQLKQRGNHGAISAQGSASARRTLEREFDDASESRHSVLVDGFADTQPAPQEFTQHGSLLLQ
jgi:uncharacterized protein HemX